MAKELDSEDESDLEGHLVDEGDSCEQRTTPNLWSGRLRRRNLSHSPNPDIANARKSLERYLFDGSSGQIDPYDSVSGVPEEQDGEDSEDSAVFKRSRDRGRDRPVLSVRDLVLDETEGVRIRKRRKSDSSRSRPVVPDASSGKHSTRIHPSADGSPRYSRRKFFAPKMDVVGVDGQEEGNSVRNHSTRISPTLLIPGADGGPRYSRRKLLTPNMDVVGVDRQKEGNPMRKHSTRIRPTLHIPGADGIARNSPRKLLAPKIDADRQEEGNSMRNHSTQIRPTLHIPGPDGSPRYFRREFLASNSDVVGANGQGGNPMRNHYTRIRPASHKPDPDGSPRYSPIQLPAPNIDVVGADGQGGNPMRPVLLSERSSDFLYANQPIPCTGPCPDFEPRILDLIISETFEMVDQTDSCVGFNTRNLKVEGSVGDMILRFGVLESYCTHYPTSGVPLPIETILREKFRFSNFLDLFQRTGQRTWEITSFLEISENKISHLRPWPAPSSNLLNENEFDYPELHFDTTEPCVVLRRKLLGGHDDTFQKLDWYSLKANNFKMNDFLLRFGVQNLDPEVDVSNPPSADVYACAELYKFAKGKGRGWHWKFMGRHDCYLKNGYAIDSRGDFDQSGPWIF